jgi:hypothetical protein
VATRAWLAPKRGPILAATGAGGAALAATAPSPARGEGAWSAGGAEARGEEADPAG